MASTPRKSPGARGGRRSCGSAGLPSITVGFVGLGAMGTPMAVNLVRSGFRMRIWNRTAERTVPLVRLGAVACETAGECARDAQVVITMVSDKDALAAVLAGDHGILAGLGKRTVVVDMSTVGRAAAREAARAVEGAGGRFVDAPVSGSVRPAE